MNLVKPSKGRVTNPFSPAHKAIDFGWGNGKQVYAAASGTARLSADRYYGLRIFIHHEDGTKTEYSHLNSRLAYDGEHVTQGQQIAVMGNSGSYAIFVHLHFALWVAGKRVKPTFGGTTPASPNKPTPIRSKDIDMFVIRAKYYYLIDARGAFRLTQPEAAAWQKQLGGGNVAVVSSAQATIIIKSAAKNGHYSANQIAALIGDEHGITEADAQRIADATVDELAERLTN